MADSTGKTIVNAGYHRVGLLATGFTMARNFYKGHIQKQYGIDVIVPHESERSVVHEIIYDELCQGVVKDSSRHAYIDVIESLKAKGAQGLILGCTEIGLLLSEKDTNLPLFDSTILHVQDAVEWLLDDK